MQRACRQKQNALSQTRQALQRALSLARRLVVLMFCVCLLIFLFFSWIFCRPSSGIIAWISVFCRIGQNRVPLFCLRNVNHVFTNQSCNAPADIWPIPVYAPLGCMTLWSAYRDAYGKASKQLYKSDILLPGASTVSQNDVPWYICSFEFEWFSLHDRI